MPVYLRPILSLLCGVGLLLLGSGLVNTLVSVRASALGYASGLVGALTSAYFVGFFAGTFLAPPLIRRIGHIRAFAFYSACCTCTVLLHTLGDGAWLWLLARLLLGLALVGMYTVIESWLNAQADPAHRGQVFATYMVVNLGALTLAQQLLRLEGQHAFFAFVLVALLISSASLPVLLTRQSQPQLPPAPRLQLRRLFAAAPTSGAGALLSGLAMGAFWGLMPAYLTGRGLDAAAVGTTMSAAILGGALLQWPIGRLSDRRDRRLVLAIVCLVAAVAALLSPLASGHRGAQLALAFVYGGMAFAIYPIVVAHLVDHLPPEDLLAASGSALLLTGLGSALGPLAAGALMSAVGPEALFGWFALLLGALAAYAAHRYRAFRRQRPDAPHFLPMLRTSHASLDLIGEPHEAADASARTLATPASAPHDRP